MSTATQMGIVWENRADRLTQPFALPNSLVTVTAAADDAVCHCRAAHVMVINNGGVHCLGGSCSFSEEEETIISAIENNQRGG